MESYSRRTCCIVGGGPAGIVLGYLLARAGIEVQILEKHTDFLHDFRGDTVHPSTLELMHELGVLEDLLRLPHQRLTKVRGRIGGEEVVLNDMTHLGTHCKFMALMPQWHFLNFLANQGNRFPTFHLKMRTEVTTLIEDNGRVAGIRAVAPDGPVEIRADLVVAADGRSSVLRGRAGLMVDEIAAAIDVLWMRLSKHLDDPAFVIHANRGKALVMLDRGEYWQCGLVISKGSAAEMQVEGIEGVRHVSCRRCGDQPCFPRRRRGRQPIGTTTPRGRSPHQSSRENTTPEGDASQVHTARAGRNPPPGSHKSAPAMALALVGSHNSAAPHTHPLRQPRNSARACGDSRRLRRRLS